VPARIKLAGLLVREQKRPHYALKVLEGLAYSPLSEKLEKLRSSIVCEAQKLIDEGVLELEGRAW
jgi:hypothetical protein